MRRRILGFVAAMVASVVAVMVSGTAWAADLPPYPAPPAGGSGAHGAPAAAVAPLASDPSSGLAYTGSGINLAVTLGIAAAVLAVGIALVMFGMRRMRAGTRS